MQDDEIALFNGCTNLVSLRKSEAFPLHLLQSKRSGEWIQVREICSDAGVAAGELKPELFAAWLPDPRGREAYAVILFYDDESKWSMAAHYNRGRLVDDASNNSISRPVHAGNGALSGPSSQHTSRRLRFSAEETMS
jgi:hypothetical protein